MNDVSSREPRAAVPPLKARLPKLSRGFLTEEDAAYWVHSQIPTNTDREYGRVILLMPDGDFVATRPVRGEVNRFDNRTIIDIDSKGNYVHPKGYTCVANVHSHPAAHDKVGEANPGQDEATLRLFLNFFSDIDFIADVSERSFFRSAYLSGPDGSLLKYSPSGSKEETSYYLWLRAGAPRGNPVGVFGVVNIIRKVASIGELKVIVSNADWSGFVGKVPSDWQPGKTFPRQVLTELPLMTRICVSAERAVLAALKPLGAETSGLVLKNLAVNEYVATQARPAGLSSWNPAFFFPRDDNGQLKLPAGWVLDGFYYASRPDPSRFPPIQPWLYENFFTPIEMALAVACHAKSKALSDRPLSLYMQARDSSMLKYRFSGSKFEAALSVNKPDGTIDDGGLQVRMQAGTLQPREFVFTLARTGGLEVLRGSPLWDRLGPVGLDWVPFADFSWPKMSPAFLSADDAARYVHDKIGNRRERQYAGFVFQRSDKRFIATEPLEGNIESIGLGRLYPRDNESRLIFPDDHVLKGHFVSHEALSRLDPVKVERLKWSRQEAALSLQMLSVEETRQALLDEVPLYLSGAQTSLIRFEPFETTTAQELEKRLGTPKHPGPLAVALETGASMPSDFIREQAAAGLLTVLVNSEMWGLRGRVTAAWSPPSLPWKWVRPAQVAFGAVFSSADEAAEDQYNRDVRLHDQEQAWFGFILKHNEREEYVATELAPIGDRTNSVFQPQSLFGVSRVPPWYQYPEGFQRHAFFYSRQRLKHLADGRKSWLSQYFITAEDLFSAVYYSRRRPVTESAGPIALYISSQDGAFLKFDNRKGNKLFDNDTPNMGLEDIKKNLTSGKLQPEDFVRVVAHHGGLKVMRTSLCWDRPWPVDQNWRPYMNLQRRWLGPAFHQPDDAVLHARSRMSDHSGKRFGGLLLKRADGLYLATDPIEVQQENFDDEEIFPDVYRQSGLYPANCIAVGRYRSRASTELALVMSEVEKQIYLNMLSVDTLLTAFQQSILTRKTEYLFGPDGCVVRYNSGPYNEFVAILKIMLTGRRGAPGELDSRQIKQHIHDGTLKPSEWVSALVKAGSLHVVIGSRLWGSAGPVTHWQPYPAFPPSVLDYARALSEPACSPIFIQDNAAARHAHEASGDRTAQTFGFILWNRRSGVFFASMPVETHHSRMATDRVFPQGTLPDQYVLHALYLSAQRAAEGPLDDDSRQFLFSPLDVHQMREAADTPQGFRPIYFSCADGALLRYEMNIFESGEFFDDFGQGQLRKNSFASLEQATRDESDVSRGRFDLSDYIQRMARAGKLEVIVTSDYWSRHGMVDEGWLPRMADVSSRERWAANPKPALGPVFQHADDAARYTQHRAGSGYESVGGFESAILTRTPRLLDRSTRFIPLEPLPSSATGENLLDRIFRKAGDSSTTFHNPSPLYPADYTLMATHQLYLSGNTTLAPDTEEVYANFASPSMVHAHTHDLKSKGFGIKDYYYSTPHGVLIRLTPAYTIAERDLLLTKPVVFKGGKWEAGLSPAEFISRLVDVADFRVLIAGHYWRQTGRMGLKWRERRKLPSQLGFVRGRDEL